MERSQQFAALAAELAAVRGVPCTATPERRVAGGSGGECYAWASERGLMFVKLGAVDAAAALAAEAAGLEALGSAQALRVPRVLAQGHTDAAAFLALEWLEAVPADAACERQLGEGLAALHAVTAARFGWDRDNNIGRTAQTNTWTDGWVEFWREQRLQPQLALAAQRGYAGLLAAHGEQLLESVPALLAGHRPAASLLHGDLWGGNWMAAAGGEPVIFDPAVYYGDRETDVAMTRLFGGFGSAFYRAYQAVAPLPAGATVRAQLYNLYHVLNHANLFGAGYARQARAMMQSLLAEVRA
jgi:protein-ribulosamine 3-kinase